MLKCMEQNLFYKEFGWPTQIVIFYFPCFMPSSLLWFLWCLSSANNYVCGHPLDLSAEADVMKPALLRSSTVTNDRHQSFVVCAANQIALLYRTDVYDLKVFCLSIRQRPHITHRAKGKNWKEFWQDCKGLTPTGNSRKNNANSLGCPFYSHL